MCFLKQAFNIKVFLVISPACVLSVALQESGCIDYIVQLVSNISQGFLPIMTMAILFITIAMLNEIMSDNAVRLIFTPMVMGFAETTDADLKLFIFCLFFAANCAFTILISYQSSILVMGLGNSNLLITIKLE